MVYFTCRLRELVKNLIVSPAELPERFQILAGTTALKRSGKRA